MLQQLLQLMAEGQGSTAVPGLAARLGVSPALVEQMIEQLVRLGYLQAVEPGCGQSACSHCSQAGSCTAQAHVRLWAVTPKGRQWVRQRSA